MQTYDQACAIPFRQHNNQTEFCLVTSAGKGRWVFPKGYIDPGETFLETALKEASEEAGLHGAVAGRPLGTFRYRKDGDLLTVVAVLMQVARCDRDWPESGFRRRKWTTADKVLQLLNRSEMIEVFELAVARLQGRSLPSSPAKT